MRAWTAIAKAAPIALPDTMYESLVDDYAKPARAYHNLTHINEAIASWKDIDLRVGWEMPVETFLALVFHDAVYVAGRNDNEVQSARLARRRLVGLTSARLDEIERLILLTEKHGRLAPADVGRDDALFLDCDMSILGASNRRFDEYDRAIRSEYAFLPDDVYSTGRRRFIERLLARPRIFLSDDFHARLEDRARENLSRGPS